MAFVAKVEPLHMRIVSNLRESRTLAAIRDALLPKLLSGKIRVKDAEKFLEKTTS
jgi:type I restriction enzyme S subunit